MLNQVSNYLPSISSTISRVPERYIWCCCIGLHSAPRYLVAAAYFNFYRGRFCGKQPELLLSALAFICSVTENTGLLLLTYVSSTETYSECQWPDATRFVPLLCVLLLVSTSNPLIGCS